MVHKQQEVPWRGIAWNIVHNYLYKIQRLSLPTLVVMAMSLHTNGLEFIKSIKAGRESSGHMDHIFPLNKACYSMLVSLHQFFTKVCLSKHHDHLSTLHTTLLLPGFSVKECRLQNWEKMGLWMCIKNYKSTVYKMEFIWSTLDDQNPSDSHLTLPSQPSFDWILHLQVHTLLIDSGRRYVSLDADKGKLQPFLFHVPMQKTSPIGKGQKKGIERLTISEWKWWLEKASLIFKAQIKNTSLV